MSIESCATLLANQMEKKREPSKDLGEYNKPVAEDISLELADHSKSIHNPYCTNT